MRLTERGSIMVLTLFGAVGLFLIIGLFLSYAQAQYQLVRGQVATDHFHKSLLRIKSKSLESFAEKYQKVSTLVAGREGNVALIKSENWDMLVGEIEATKRSYNGYKGRMASSVGHMLDAQHTLMKNLNLISSNVSEWPVVPVGVLFEDETGEQYYSDEGAYVRLWKNKKGPYWPHESIVQMSVGTHGGAATLISQGRLRWDVDKESGGGYPENGSDLWSEQYPYYRGELHEAED